MSNEDLNRLRRTFDEVAELYQSARPGYPVELIDDLIDLTGLDTGDVVLEIGCGSGQATRPLAERGYRIVCVELGERLAEVARREFAHFADVRVVTGSFEEWNPQGQHFDLVLAATSWHWLDPEVRFDKAAEILNPHGALTIVSTHHVFPGDADPFFSEIQKTYNKIGEGLDEEWPPPPPESVPDDREEIEASGFFGGVEVRRYLWSESYDVKEYLSLLNTYSGHRLMDGDKREFLYQEIRRLFRARPEHRIRKDYLNILHVAKRTSRDQKIERA